MGGSAKSGSSASKRYNYFGTIAGVVGPGLVTELIGIEVDDKMLWTGSVLEASSPNPVEITVPGRGLVRFYWGRDDQTTPDSKLTAAGNGLGQDHSAYRNVAYFVAVDFLFGLEKTSAPNIRFHYARKPKQTIITGAAANLINRQANPFAILAEIYESGQLGRALPTSLMDTASWQAAADDCYAEHAKTYLSVLINEKKSFKSIREEILAICDGYVRPKSTNGKAEAGRFAKPETIVPSSLPLINAHTRTADVDGEDDTWEDVYTRVVVNYRDRDKNFKERSVQYDDPSGRRLGVKRRTKTISVPYIVRRDQAIAYAQRLGTRFAIPGATGKESVRPETATALQPGQHIRVDIDPIPGGTERQKVCRVVKITRSPEGSTLIEWEAEPLMEATIYTPSVPVPPTPPEIVIPDIATARFFESPYPLAGGDPYRIGVLASRPAGMVTAFRVHYDDVTAGDFPPLGDSRSYALRGQLNGAYSAAATGALNVEILDTHNREIIADNPGETAARNDDLLMIVFKLSSGQIAADGEGKAFMEIFSVEEIVSTAPNFVDITALRARQGTPARDLPDDAEVWFIRRSALTILEHADFPGLAQTEGDAFFKLQPSGPEGERPIEDCPERTFTFALARDVPPLFPDDGITPDPVSSVTVEGAVNSIWIYYTLPLNTPLRTVRFYVGLTTTRPSTPSFAVSGSQNFATIQGLAASVTRYIWIEVEAENGRLSTIMGHYAATTLSLEIDLPEGSTIPTVVNALPATDNFEGRMVVLTTDDKLYRWTHPTETTGTTYWTAAVAAADVTGTLADSQIAALAASKITGTLTDSQIAALAAAKLTGQITQTQITDNAISTSKIAANAITTGKLASDAVTANELAANAVTAAKIQSGAVETAKLAAGAVVAEKIAAGAITTSKLLVAPGVGGYVNPDPLLQDPLAWTIPNLTGSSPVHFPGFNEGDGLGSVWDKVDGGTAWIVGPKFPISSFKTYLLQSSLYTYSGTLAIHYLCVIFYDANGSVLAGSSYPTGWPGAGAYHYYGLIGVSASSGATRYQVQMGANAIAKIPANATHAAAAILGAYDNAAGRWCWGGAQVREMSPAELIVDGAITTDKLTANAVTAGKIAAGAVEADKIAANAVSADKIAANAIVAAKIDTGAVTTNKLAAAAVTAEKMSVSQLSAITATIGTLQTATSGARTKIQDNLIQVFDSANVARLEFGILP